MLKFNQLESVHLEISNNCQASCPMCSRNINGGLDNPMLTKSDWTLADFKYIMNEQVLTQIQRFMLCGTFGDPMMNDDIIEMIRYSTEVNHKLSIHLHTNGGARRPDWWTELAKAMPSEHLVIFALDGLEDTHSLYRVGTNFNKVIENARAFIQAGGNAEWAFIRFKHNEHHVDLAHEMSNRLGFKSFAVKNSSRFLIEPRVKVVDRQGNYTHNIEPATEVKMKFIDAKIIREYKKILANSTIDCKAIHDKEIYIDAHKNFFACCWLANVPYAYVPEDEVAEVRLEMQRQHLEMQSKLGETNMLKRSIENIVNSESFQTIWDEYWTTNKLIVCGRSCGKGETIDFAQPKDQYE